MKIAAPLTKNILLPFELSERASATETEKKKKIYGVGVTVVISIKEITKIIKSVKDSGQLTKGVTICASLLGNTLARRGIVITDYGRKGQEILIAGYGENQNC